MTEAQLCEGLRAAFNAEPRTLGKSYMVYFKGAHFLLSQTRAGPRTGGPGALHMLQIRPARALPELPLVPTVFKYRITASNELVSVGYGHEATTQDVRLWEQQIAALAD